MNRGRSSNIGRERPSLPRGDKEVMKDTRLHPEKRKLYRGTPAFIGERKRHLTLNKEKGQHHLSMAETSSENQTKPQKKASQVGGVPS